MNKMKFVNKDGKVKTVKLSQAKVNMFGGLGLYRQDAVALMKQQGYVPKNK